MSHSSQAPEAQTSAVLDDLQPIRVISPRFGWAKARRMPLSRWCAALAFALMIAATLDLLEGEVRSRHCTLVREGDWSGARVPLDADSLKQVFLNLLLNALEASPEGGRVTASLERRGERVWVRVRDQGTGLPPEVLARLGEPFLTTKAQGTGLGLFLSRRLVRSAGGELSASTHAEGGAEVVVALPVVA